jgi:microcystin-dependent protein
MAYVGEIRIFPWGAIPPGWLPCDGRVASLEAGSTSQGYEQLFSVIGDAFGGDGQTSFALPDLSGKVPVGAAPGFPWGGEGGESTHQRGGSGMPAYMALSFCIACEGDLPPRG